MRKKYDLRWCQDYAKSRGGVCLSVEYKGTLTALEYRCAEGHEFSARPTKHIYDASWCPTCLAAKPVPEAEVRALVAAKGFTLIGDFNGSNKKMLLQCQNGHHWYCTLTNFKHTKHGCPECSKTANDFVRSKTRKYSIADLRGMAKARLGECLSMADAPNRYMVATVERGRFRCADGHEWETPFGSIVYGHWCPQCAINASTLGKNLNNRPGGIATELPSKGRAKALVSNASALLSAVGVFEDRNLVEQPLID